MKKIAIATAIVVATATTAMATPGAVNGKGCHGKGHHHCHSKGEIMVKNGFRFVPGHFPNDD